MNTDKRRTGPMGRYLRSIITLLLCAALLFSLSACAMTRQTPAKVRVLIVPKFEIDEMSGDFPGEAQLFYEKYCPGEQPKDIRNLPETAQFYFNEKTGAAVLVTGAGKMAATLAMTTVLNDPGLDFSDAYIVSVGCSGGSCECTTLGDVVIVTAACDNELGHTADIREFDDPDTEVTWFYDNSFDSTSAKLLNAELADQVYELTKDVPLQTTEISQKILKRNFPDEEWMLRAPKVLKGAALTGDSYWKGIYGHKNALAVIEAYGCPDPYAVTEMEDLAVANAADCCGMLDRLVTIRVVVNVDVFLDGDSPESLWREADDYNGAVQEMNNETLDIFEPGMYNLFDVSELVIDAVLSESIG